MSRKEILNLEAINKALHQDSERDFKVVYRLVAHIVKSNLKRQLSTFKYQSEDVIQEVCINIWQSRNRIVFSSFSRFCAYVTFVAKNALIDMTRIKSYKCENSGYDLTLFNKHTSENNESFDVVAICDKMLYNGKNEHLRLYIEGYTYNEIAEIKGVPIGTVKTKIHVQRSRFKPILK